MRFSVGNAVRVLVHPVVALSITNGATLVVSLGLSVIVGWRFGASALLDTLLVAQAVPLVLASIGVGIIQYVCMPYIARIADVERRRGAVALIVSVAVGGGFAVGLGVLSIMSTAGTYIFGLETSRLELLSTLTLILIVIIPLRTIAALGSALYQLESRYSLPALVTLLGSVVALAIVFRLSDQIGIAAVALGLVAVPVVTALGSTSKLVQSSSWGAMSFGKDRVLVGMAGLQIAVYSISQSHVLWDRLIGGRLPEGSLSYLFYAERVISGVGALVGSGLTVYVLPRFSNALSSGDFNGAKRLFAKAMTLMLITTVPIVVILVSAGESLIGLIFERNSFVQKDTIATFEVLSYYAPALVFNLLAGICVALLYSAMKQRMVLAVALAGAVIHATLAFAGGTLLGAKGLALAHTITGAINCAALLGASIVLLRAAK